MCVGPKGTQINSWCVCACVRVDYVSAFLNASNNYYIAYTNNPAGVDVPFLGFRRARQETACLNISVDCCFPWIGSCLSIRLNYFWYLFKPTLILLSSVWGMSDCLFLVNCQKYNFSFKIRTRQIIIYLHDYFLWIFLLLPLDLMIMYLKEAN